MTTPRDDEPPRDAWLREALRHAPDADAAPPPDISAAILRQAHDAVKDAGRGAARPAAPSHPLWQLWSWLARPPVAAGFATVMVATLVGVMWWDQPLDASLPRQEPPAATVAPAPAAPPAAPPAPAPITTPLAAAAPPRAQDDATPATKRASKETATTLAARRDEARERASTDHTEQARAAATEASRARSAVAAAAPPPAAPVPPPKSTPADEPVAEPAIGDTRDAAPSPRGASAQGLTRSAPALALRKQEAVSATPAIDQLERWTWQRGGTEQAMTPALQRWLAQLDGAARWRAAEAAPPTSEVAVLRLWRDGALRATLQLGADAVWLTPAGGTPLVATLSPASAAALQASLLAATP